MNSSTFLTDLSPKDKPWDDHKAASQVVSDNYNQFGSSRYSSRVFQCSQLLDFALKSVPDQEHGEVKFRLAGANFCRVRFCPICQWRRSLKWRARFFESLPKILADFPTHRFIFATFTIRNVELLGLRDAIESMNIAWSKMVRRKAFPALGWVKSTEVTRSKTGQAHPHFHCLLMVPSTYFNGDYYLPQSGWTAMWQKSMKLDYVPMVDIRAIKANSKESLADQVCHVLKYSVKVKDLTIDPYWLGKLTEQLHGTRAIALGGVFKKYLSEIEPDDLIHIKEDDQEDLEIEVSDAHLLFSWHPKVKKYCLKENS